MNKDEKEELLRYFKLSDYREGDYFLQEEYEELEDIIKRNSIAKELEDARYKYILGIISEKEYNELYDKYLNLTLDDTKEKTRLI